MYVHIAEFEKFLQEYERELFSFCKYITMDEHVARDLYQDTVLDAFTIISRIDSTNNPKSFLFSIAIGKWKNMRRKVARRQKIAPEMPLEDAYLASNSSDFSSRTKYGNPEVEMQRSMLNEHIQKALSEIKEKFRIPLILFYFEDYPTETIATICKIPTGTVKSRLHKGRALLKKALEKEGYTNGV